MARADQESTNLPYLADIDRLIHEPARLLIMALLAVVESADFLFLMRQTGLTQGNLSSHLSKLEEAGYVRVEKAFHGKRPKTTLRMSSAGRSAFAAYRSQLDQMLADLPPTNDTDHGR